MLDAFIIEQIRKREQVENVDRPTLDLPLPSERDPHDDRERGSKPSWHDGSESDEGQRGVVIIDFGS